MVTMTSVEAQNSFGKLLDTVQRDADTITRHGRPTAFVVLPQDMEELLDSRRRRGGAVADLEAWRAETLVRVDEEQAAEADALTDADVARLVHEAR